MTKPKPEWRLKPVKRFLVIPGNVNTPPVPADDTRAALAELVAIDDLPMALHSLPFRDQVAIAERKRLAWAAARAALARAEPTDWTEVGSKVAAMMAKAKAPLSADQQIMLVGFLASWFAIKGEPVRGSDGI